MIADKEKQDKQFFITSRKTDFNYDKKNMKNSFQLPFDCVPVFSYHK